MRGAIGTATAVLLLILPHAATAGTACWERVLQDSGDGRVDGTYPVECYRKALTRLPVDLQAYTNAPDAIRAALQRRLTLRAGPPSIAAANLRDPRASSGWAKALPMVGLAGAAALVVAGAMTLAVRGTRKRRGR